MIVRSDGRSYLGTNSCCVAGLSECPRVTANSPSGLDYELCGPQEHAEAAAARKAADSSDLPGEAFLFGHTYACADCQHALQAINVRTIHITGQPWAG